jgi:hypothetical protein
MKKIAKSPDVSKMKSVRIDSKTTIYIRADRSEDEARNEYLLKVGEQERRKKEPKMMTIQTDKQ